ARDLPRRRRSGRLADGDARRGCRGHAGGCRPPGLRRPILHGRAGPGAQQRRPQGCAPGPRRGGPPVGVRPRVDLSYPGQAAHGPVGLGGQAAARGRAHAAAAAARRTAGRRHRHRSTHRGGLPARGRSGRWSAPLRRGAGGPSRPRGATAGGATLPGAAQRAIPAALAPVVRTDQRRKLGSRVVKTWTTVAVPDLPGRGKPLRIMDTATGAPQLVHPDDGRAGLYVCGITPYDATHMGHAATYVTFDLVVRVWRDAGLDVTYVQNVTDVDEPLLERAERDGLDWQELADQQIALFQEDMEELN